MYEAVHSSGNMDTSTINLADYYTRGFGLQANDLEAVLLLSYKDN